MVTRNKLPAASVLLGSLLWTASAGAYEIQTNTAKMQAMDKITGRVSVIEVPVNGEVKFGSFSIVVRACKKTPPEETPKIPLLLTRLIQAKTESHIIFLRGG